MFTRCSTLFLLSVLCLTKASADPLGQWSSSPTAVSNYTALTYANGIFVATASPNPNVGWLGYSRDGVHWETANCGGGDCLLPPLFQVTFANGRFVAAGALGMSYTSTNGIDWHAYEIPSSGSALRDVCFGGGNFVVVGDNDSCPCGFAAASPDGVTWTALESESLLSLQGVAYGNGRFVAVGRSKYELATSSANIFTATNPLVPWIRRSLPTTNNFLSVAFGRGRFVAVGHEQHSGAARISWSENGDLWTPSDPIVTNPLTHVSFAAGSFLATDSSGHIVNSRDGLTWQLHTLPAAALQTAPICANGSLFAATANGILRSASLSSVLLSVGPQLELTVFGLEGRDVRIESSPDLSPNSWKEAGVLTLYSSPTIWRSDRPSNSPASFYRSVLLE